MLNPPKVKIYKTEGEWKVIQERLEKMNRKSIRLYIRTEVLKLSKRFDECPESITCANGKKKQMQFIMDAQTNVALRKLAIQMKCPMSKIVEDFFITPLLLPDLSLNI